MPAHLRALVVILVFALAVFLLAKAPITARACSEQDFTRRRNLWFALTLSAFLAHSFWLFVLVASCVLVVGMRTESNRFALYLSLVLTLPYLAAELPGLGFFNQLFSLTQMRLLALVVLLPTYLTLRRRPGVEPFGRLLCDKLLLGSFALDIVLTFPHTTFTNFLRVSVVYPFIDVFLIYYVASRSLRSLTAFRDAFGAFVVGAMVFCAILAFEFGRHWLLYRGLGAALGASSASESIYLLRAGLLRAVGTAQDSIVAGYTCAIAIGLYMYVMTLVPNVAWRSLGMLVLITGIIAALARAPWLGAAMMIMLFIMLGPTPIANLAKLAVAGLVAVPILLSTGAGDTIVDFLPWVGSVDARNVDGRELLATVALQIIGEYPFFGRYDFALDPALEQLRGGDGRIDLVNTYIIIALGGGYVSLALFVGVAAVAAVGIVVGLFRVGDRRDERHALGRSLLATLVGVLFIIGTVSPIFFVYPLYWCLIGLAVGYGCLIARGEPHLKSDAAASAQGNPAPRARWATATRKEAAASTPVPRGETGLRR